MHRPVPDDVVHIALQQHVRVQRDVDLGECGTDMLVGVQIDPAEGRLQLAGTRIGELDVAPVGIGLVFGALAQIADQPDDLDARRLAV